MRLRLILGTFYSLALASPVTTGLLKRDSTPHPAVATLTFVATQFANVLQEINQYSAGGDRAALDRIFRDARETLATLDKAARQIDEGKEFDIWTASTFALPIGSVGVEVHQFASALKTKKPDFVKDGAQGSVFNLLNQAHVQAKHLQDIMIQKIPQALRWIATPIADQMLATVAGAKDLYQPDAESASATTNAPYVENSPTIVVITEAGGSPQANQGGAIGGTPTAPMYLGFPYLPSGYIIVPAYPMPSGASAMPLPSGAVPFFPWPVPVAPGASGAPSPYPFPPYYPGPYTVYQPQLQSATPTASSASRMILD
jgi:hypothetical protein